MDYWMDGLKGNDRMNFREDVQIEDLMEWRDKGDCDEMIWLWLNRYSPDDVAGMIL